jgi:AcrR family transcriptional regulator
VRQAGVLDTESAPIDERLRLGWRVSQTPVADVASEPALPAPSRRENHKSRTRQALRQAALELFASQGFDTTTTEEIAERAGVSVRTFFRYFPTKELVLFFGRYDFMKAVLDEFLRQPKSLSDLAAMRAAYLASAPGLAERRKALRLYERAVASSPMLRGSEQDRQIADVNTIAEAVASRHGLTEPDERSSLLGAICLMTYRRALARWLAGAASADFAEAVADEFDLLEGLLGDA